MNNNFDGFSHVVLLLLLNKYSTSDSHACTSRVLVDSIFSCQTRRRTSSVILDTVIFEFSDFISFRPSECRLSCIRSRSAEEWERDASHHPVRRQISLFTFPTRMIKHWGKHWDESSSRLFQIPKLDDSKTDLEFPSTMDFPLFVRSKECVTRNILRRSNEQKNDGFWLLCIPPYKLLVQLCSQILFSLDQTTFSQRYAQERFWVKMRQTQRITSLPSDEISSPRTV